MQLASISNFILVFHAIKKKHKTSSSEVMKKKTYFMGSNIGFWGRHFGIVRGYPSFMTKWPLKKCCTKFHACSTICSTFHLSAALLVKTRGC